MRTFSLAILLSLVVACSAEKAPPPGPTFTPERFRAHVAFLADDLLEGRDTGSRGHEIAARYVASRFETLGLKPGGNNGSWYQQVGFQKTQRGGAPGTLTLSGAPGAGKWTHGQDVI